MPIMQHDKQALDQIFSDWSGTYKGRKEDYFALLYLSKKFRCDIPDIANHVCFGGCDYGIDAFHIDPDTRNLYLYQFKWSENHNLFKESMDRLAKDGLERIFGAPLVDPNQNDILNTLRAELVEHKSLIERVLVHFVFKGDIAAAESSTGLDYRRETLNAKRYLIGKFFGSDDVEFAVEFISDRRLPPLPIPVESHVISLASHVRFRSDDCAREMYVGFVPIMDIYRVYRSLDKRFLDRNIRAGLPDDRPPNRRIKEAISDIVFNGKSPEVFAFNHNGVTLAAERLDFDNGRAVIHVPRLLNGAQTITSVSKFIANNEGHPALKGAHDGKALALEAIRVLTKIVIDEPTSDFITQVTICNNQQNPVDAWNLRANDKIQCDLHDLLKANNGVFYSRQENALRSYTSPQLDEMGYNSTVHRDVRIRQLAQTFLAIQGEIGRMSKLPEVFENQKQYDDTFKESYPHSDARKIVLAYKVGLIIKDPIQRLQERSSQKIGYAIARARNLVWSLLIQALFNDRKLPVYLEDFGTTLKKEGAFRDLLEKLASSRLLPIFKDVLAKPEHAERMASEKYDFLRTKEIFNQCKNVAADRFGWTKKSL